MSGRMTLDDAADDAGQCQPETQGIRGFQGWLTLLTLENHKLGHTELFDTIQIPVALLRLIGNPPSASVSSVSRAPAGAPLLGISLQFTGPVRAGVGSGGGEEPMRFLPVTI
jgi:hypothetical protein